MPSDAVSLTDVFLRERSSLIKFLCRYLDRWTSEDACQSLYLKLSSNAAAVPQDAKAYIYRAAYHHAVDRVRAERRERSVLDEAAWMLQGGDVQDGEGALSARVDLERLTARVLALPEPTQRIFVLNRYQGMPEREIAALLGISKTLVAKHVRRALDALADGY